MSITQNQFIISENIKNHIKEFSEFEQLLNQELFALRRSMGFKWYGTPAIKNCENIHMNERIKINNILESKYNTTNEVTNILIEYTIIDPLDRFYKFNRAYTEIDSLSQNELLKYYILKEFVNNYTQYYNTFHIMYSYCCSITICKNLLQPFRDVIYKQQIFKKKQLQYDLLTECAICMDSSIQIDIMTNCNHQFHKSCILSWLNSTESCPLCRHKSVCIFDVEIKSN